MNIYAIIESINTRNGHGGLDIVTIVVPTTEYDYPPTCTIQHLTIGSPPCNISYNRYTLSNYYKIDGNLLVRCDTHGGLGWLDYKVLFQTNDKESYNLQVRELRMIDQL